MPQARGAGSALVLPRLGDLRPYLLLALLTALLLTAVYAVRPVVRIDMGSDEDAAFLRDFNGREIDAAGASESYRWAPGQETLTVPGRRAGVWIALLRVAPGQPADILESAAVAVNGERVDMPRRTADTVLAKITPELGAAEQLTISLVSPLVGGALPPKDIVGEVTLAPARTYRWTQGTSAIVLPNLGRGAWTVQMNYVAVHPDGQPLEAEVWANGQLLAALPDNAEPRWVSLLVPAEAVRDGSLELTVRANTFNDPRPLGVLLSEIVVAPAGAGGVATVLPPLAGLGQALVIVLGSFACLHLIVGNQRPKLRGRLPAYAWAALGVALVAVLGGWALTTYRFPSSFMLPRLAWLAVWSLLLLAIVRPLTRWLFRAAGLPIEEAGDEQQATAQSHPEASPQAPGIRHQASGITGRAFLSMLLLLFFVGYWLKAAGMLYPYFVAIDVQWHMDRARWINEGALPLLYGTSSPLNETTMPTAEWGANRPVIPYSPWFHIFASTFVYSPLGMSLTGNMLSLMFDSARLVLIALIACKAGLSRRGALIAAATFAVVPVTYLLHSWGNLPTAFGLWLTLLCNTIILCFWERLGERRVMITLSLLLLLTFLLYTVTGVFMGVFLVVLTALVWLNGLRGGVWATLRRGLKPLWLASGVAIALALIIYYGQYIPPIIAQTVPYMSTVFTQGPESVGVERPPFGQYMWGFIPHLDYRIWPGDFLFYGIAIPMLFVVPGFMALRKRPLTWVLFAAWLSVAVLFMFAGYRISMVDKQIFYMLPVMCVCWALYADRLWERGRWGRLVVLAVLLYSLVAALDQWLLRIATSPVVG